MAVAGGNNTPVVWRDNLWRLWAILATPANFHKNTDKSRVLLHSGDIASQESFDKFEANLLASRLNVTPDKVEYQYGPALNHEEFTLSDAQVFDRFALPIINGKFIGLHPAKIRQSLNLDADFGSDKIWVIVSLFNACWISRSRANDSTPVFLSLKNPLLDTMKQLLIILTTCLFFCVQTFTTAAEKPNVVIIFIDDMGYGDIGPFGATKQKTPNLDRMAAEGMKLTSFYAAPVCSVSRAQLLTGCYGARIDVPGVYGPGNARGLNPTEHTIAERLKELGYATMCIGKWHVGDQPEFLPTKQGFDHYFGIPYSNDMQAKSTVSGERVVPLLRDDKVAELLSGEQQSHIVERYTAEAVRFITEHKDKPFLLYLPHTAIHTPIYPGEKFRGKSSNGRVGDWIEEVDWSTGRVLDTLRDLKLEQNTLVIFTSDNGPWLSQGADSGSAGPLRGGKGSTWEGGVREPTLAWWPGKIAPGTSVDTIAGTIDLLPTAVAIAGGKLPPQPVIDGRDLSPLLLGKTKDSPRGVHYYFSQYKLQAVRQGPWKLALMPQNEAMGRSVEPDAQTTSPRLYNLDKEIGEKTNVALANPEVVAKLTALAEAMSKEIAGDQPSARRPAGKVENPAMLYPAEPRGKAAKRKPSKP